MHASYPGILTAAPCSAKLVESKLQLVRRSRSLLGNSNRFGHFSTEVYRVQSVTAAPLTGRRRDASNDVRDAYRGLKVEQDLGDQL